MKTCHGLYLILTDPIAGYETCARAAVEAGVRYLQLRMKDASRAELTKTAKMIRDITRGTQTRFIMNDNLEAAMEADADGLHLGQDDMALPEARAAWNTPGKIFGLSTHSLDQMQKASGLAPDYIGVGPVFPTLTKTDADPVLGVKEASRIINASPLPAYAIGGIHADNLPDLLAAGVKNYCVAGAVNHAADPAAALRELQRIGNGDRF